MPMNVNWDVTLEELFKKRVDADYLIERDGKDLNLEYFNNELRNVQKQSSDAMQIFNT